MLLDGMGLDARGMMQWGGIRRRKSTPVRLIFTSSTLHLLVHLKLTMLMRWYEMLWQSEAAVTLRMGIGDRREGGRAHLIDEYSLFYIDDTVWSSWSSCLVSSCCCGCWYFICRQLRINNWGGEISLWDTLSSPTNEEEDDLRQDAISGMDEWEGEEQWANKCTVALINLHSFAEINYMHKYTLFLIDYSRPMTKTACM